MFGRRTRWQCNKWGALLLLAGCGDVDLPPLRILRVTPDHAAAGASTPVTIDGRGFLLDAKVSLLDDEEGRLNANFRAQCGGVPIVDVSYEDARHLTGIVPGILAEGVHPIQVFDARGRSASLASAFRVDPPPWWDAAWIARRRLSIDGSTLSERLDDFPVLVRLDASWFDYGAVAPGGADLRFIGGGSDEPLAHEIERFDPSGESLIWVRIPRLEPPPAQVLLLMYYGNVGAAPAADAPSVWVNGFQAVYHLDGLLDSTGRLPAAINVGTQDDTGAIGRGRVFDGANHFIELGADLPLLVATGGATLSAWVNPAIANREQYLVSVSRGSATEPTNESRAMIGLLSNRRVFAGGRSTDSEPLRSATSRNNVVTVNTWQQVATVIDYAGARVALWHDGVEILTASVNFAAAQTPATSARNGALGAQDDGQTQNFNGRLDEVRIAAGARSAAWLAAEYQSVTPGMVTVGPEERGP